MNVLSLFDGMSCGQLALDRMGILYDSYFSSEIDKWAIKVTQANYPHTIQLGDVIQLYDWHLPKIDLLFGGSPCQGFSRAGKGLNWDDPRSKLFFWYVNALRRLKPKYFLFENVMMKKEIKDAISYELGVEPIMINSALVSAQSRKRLYWTNIPNVDQPMDKGILLKDIIEDGRIDKKYLFEKGHAGVIKCLNEKAGCLSGGGHSGGNHSDMTLMVYQLPRGSNKGGLKAKDGKVPSMTSSGWHYNNLLVDCEKESWRRLTPLECERLQTCPENYTNHVSNSQRYKMLGNGWTIDVIAHILGGIIVH